MVYNNNIITVGGLGTIDARERGRASLHALHRSTNLSADFGGHCWLFFCCTLHASFVRVESHIVSYVVPYLSSITRKE